MGMMGGTRFPPPRFGQPAQPTGPFTGRGDYPAQVSQPMQPMRGMPMQGNPQTPPGVMSPNMRMAFGRALRGRGKGFV